MGKCIHRIINNKCIFCKEKTNLRIKDGKLVCRNSTNRWSGATHRNKKMGNIKKTLCSLCGFIPKDTIQMDIHHKDSNHKNNSKDNLQVLCANCHRLIHKKTTIN